MSAPGPAGDDDAGSRRTGGAAATSSLRRRRRAAQELGDRAADNEHVDRLGSVGFAARSVVYVLIGVLTLRVAGAGPGESPDEEASTTGALRAVAGSPFGEVTLTVLALGLVAYTVWSLSEAAGGHRDTAGLRRVLYRCKDVARSVVYVALAVTAVQLLISGRTPDQDLTVSRVATRLMASLPGQLLVGLAGAGLLLVGLYLLVQARNVAVHERLETHHLHPRLRRVVQLLGIVGHVTRGGVLALAGAFVVKAAAQKHPEETGGTDETLRQLLAVPAGTVLVGAVGAGLVAFGLFSLLQARYFDT